jgi:C-terminal processing protease CtpA/Prc
MKGTDGSGGPARSRLALPVMVILVSALALAALLAATSAGAAQEWQRAEARLRAEELRRLSQEQAAEARARAEYLQQLVQERGLEFHAQREALRGELREVRRLMEEQAREMRARTEEVRHLSQEQAEEMRLRARDLVRDLQQVVIRTRARVRLGVELDPDQGPEYDRQGARVKGLMAGSPAEKAGLQKDDIITHLNGRSLLDPLPDAEREARLDPQESLPVQRLMELAGDMERGDEVEVRFLRDGRRDTVTFEVEDLGRGAGVTVLPRVLGGRDVIVRVPEVRLDTLRGGVFRFDPGLRFDTLRGGIFHFDPEMGLDSLRGSWFRFDPELRFDSLRGGVLRGFALGGREEPIVGMLYGRTVRGLELRDMNPDLASYFSTDRGVLVLEVDEDRELGLRPGDVILAIGDREVETARDVRRILSSYREGERVTFQVMRQGRQTRVEGRMD